jgi:hypothetical protein
MRPTLLPLTLIVLATAGFLVTMGRIPIVWPDETIYASVARAMQLRGNGIPTVLDGAPAIDHVGFYGPVYFGAAAALFDLFGFSMTTFRMLGVIGALLAATGAALVVRAAGRSARRQWWAAALVLLTPEIGGAATSGRMDAFAVGLSMIALAVYAQGLATARPPIIGGIMSGLLLAAAALTVPRTFPLIAVAVVVGLVFACSRTNRVEFRGAEETKFNPVRFPLSLWLAAVVTLLPVVAAWAVASHGGLIAWIRFHLYLAARQTTDVALAAGATREWSATPWQLITFVAACVGLALAWAWAGAPGLRQAEPDSREPRPTDACAAARAFIVTVAIANAALMIALQNLTFALASYFTIPLLAASVAAWPQAGLKSRLYDRQRAVAIALLGTLVAADLGVRTAKYVRLAVVWQASNPALLERFVRAHVPAGSAVYGPDFFYFYAVERAGSRYLAASGESAAEWTRLVKPREDGGAPSSPPDASHRYLLWPTDAALVGQPPTAFDCAGRRDIARYEPQANQQKRQPDSLGRLLGVTEGLPRTYPESVLTRLPSGCPVS